MSNQAHVNMDRWTDVEREFSAMGVAGCEGWASSYFLYSTVNTSEVSQYLTVQPLVWRNMRC